MEAAVDEGGMWANEESRALTRARAGLILLTPGTPNFFCRRDGFTCETFVPRLSHGLEQKFHGVEQKFRGGLHG